MGRWPGVTIQNLQRKISVNVAELEKFAGNAVLNSLQLHQRQRTDLRKLSEIFIWLISDRRMAQENEVARSTVKNIRDDLFGPVDD